MWGPVPSLRRRQGAHREQLRRWTDWGAHELRFGGSATTGAQCHRAAVLQDLTLKPWQPAPLKVCFPGRRAWEICPLPGYSLLGPLSRLDSQRNLGTCVLTPDYYRFIRSGVGMGGPEWIKQSATAPSSPPFLLAWGHRWEQGGCLGCGTSREGDTMPLFFQRNRNRRSVRSAHPSCLGGVG